MRSIVALIPYMVGLLIPLTNGALRCPLVWKSMGAGDTPPKDAVPVYSEVENIDTATLFIARSPIQLYLTHGPVGVYDKTSGRVHIPLSSLFDTVVVSTIVEILTNPHGCTLQWVYARKDDTLFPVAVENGRVVGRAVTVFGSGSKLISGYSEDGRMVKVATTSNNNPQNIIGSILHSHYPHIDMKMREIRVLNNNHPPGRRQFLGVDQIINNSPVKVRQSVQHESSLKEQTLLTITTNSEHSISAGFNFNLNVLVDISIPEFVERIYNFTDGTGRYNKSFTPITLNLNINKTTFGKSSGFLAIRTIKEAYVGLNREVLVEPYSSVQICSTITTQDFEVDYIAIGVYSVPGYKGDEVKALLGDRGSVVGDTVEIPEIGKFEGSVPVSTNLFVMPVDDEIGCHAVI